MTSRRKQSGSSSMMMSMKPSKEEMEYRMNLEEERRLLALERQQLTAKMKDMVDTTRTYLNCVPPLQAQTRHPVQECEPMPSS
jgi:hypothetical protein